MSQPETTQSLEKVAIVVDAPSLYVFPESLFWSYFQIDPKSQNRIISTTRDRHTICQCRRLDSFICNHELNHVKSNYEFGPQSWHVIGIYTIKDSSVYNLAGQVHPNPYLDYSLSRDISY